MRRMLRHLAGLVLVASAAAFGWAGQREEPAVQVTFMLPAGASVHGPAEVVRLLFDERAGHWAMDGAWQTPGLDGGVPVTGRPGRRYVVAIRSARGSLYVHEPFYWPALPAARWIAAGPMQSVRARFRPAPELAPIWVGADGVDASRVLPVCVNLGFGELECFGLPEGESGVLLAGTTSPVRYALVEASPDETAALQATEELSPWARLVLIRQPYGTETPHQGLTVAVRRRLAGAASFRPDFVAYSETNELIARRIGPASVWLTGSVPTEDLVLSVSGPGVAPARIELVDCCLGPPDVPVEIRLEPPRMLSVRVVTAEGSPAPSALVSLLRLIPTRGVGGQARSDVRREVSTEIWMDEQGEREVAVSPDTTYEARALHPGLGRARRIVYPQARTVELRLARSDQVHGRVLRQGMPAEGVAVRVVPDLGLVSRQADPLSSVALESVTDAHGRFALAVPDSGGGSVLIGGAAHGQVRIPLPPSPGTGARTDLGDIELGSGVIVDVQVPGSAGCDVVAAGPVGMSGLAMVGSAALSPGLHRLTLPEPGRWWASLICQGRDVPLDPQVIDVEAVAFPQRFDLQIAAPR